MGYTFVPVNAGRTRPSRNGSATFLRRSMIFLALVLFIAFILSGGIFLIIPVMLVKQLIFGRTPRPVRNARPTTQVRQPRHPYDGL